ncbi:MAG: hypothetical protein JOS17DRAFT_113825 [Linnemannia elongata]|nr:MAG: hypothetical protein JOS17DRAFT_113825 [Linnemannia elongata]
MIFVVVLLVCCFSLGFFLSSQLSSAFVVCAAGSEERGLQRDTMFVFTPFIATLLVSLPSPSSLSLHPPSPSILPLPPSLHYFYFLDREAKINHPSVPLLTLIHCLLAGCLYALLVHGRTTGRQSPRAPKKAIEKQGDVARSKTNAKKGGGGSRGSDST